jgi:hypothetical protein
MNFSERIVRPKNHFIQLDATAKGVLRNTFNCGWNDNSRKRFTITKAIDLPEMTARLKNKVI